MLISFTISGYRSFRGEQSLSMVANGRHTDHADHLAPLPGDDTMLLPVVAIYGPNAAGKSNLIAAIRHLVRAVGGVEPLALVPFMHLGEPVKLEIQLSAGGEIYLYGVSGVSDKVDEEWLYCRQGARWVPFFERGHDKAGRVEVNLGEACRTPSPKLRALATVAPRANRLFLEQVFTDLENEDTGPQLRTVFGWFAGVRVIRPDDFYLHLTDRLGAEGEFRDKVTNLLAETGTGVCGVDVEEVELQPGEAAARGIPVGALREHTPAGETRTFVIGERSIQLSGEGVVRESRVRLHHASTGGPVTFDLHEESDGTRRLLHLLPAIVPHEDIHVILIDEIDRSLHPQLSKHLVRQFLAKHGGRQLIFTTHDLNFLDLNLLRRDEIWFAEKTDGATELYSLADFKVRKDLSVDKAYLEGRFGAVPPVEQAWPAWVDAVRRDLEPRS